MGTSKLIKLKPIDILKTGPASFRELQLANQSNFSPLYQAFVNDLKIKAQPTSLFDAAALALQDVASPLNNSGTPWGKSRFDATSANDNTFNNLGDIRAENEPWYAKIGAGISKGAVLAGTTFLDGTLGLLYGAGTAISQGRISGIWDNDFSKSMQSINNYMEKELPNYYTLKEQLAAWYSPDNIFTANFLGDKFLKNLGFSIGAFYSGGVTASGLKLSKLPLLIEKVTGITNAASHVTSAVGATISAVNEGRIEALNNSGDWYKALKTILDDKYKSRIEAIQLLYQANANRQMIKTADGTYVDPAYLQYKQDIAKELNSYQGTLKKMNEDRLHMGNVDLLMNLPILTASNLILFGKMYANGFKTARKAANITGEIGNYVANTSKAKATLAFTKSALSEGNEELFQLAASNISGDYYATDVNNYYKAKTDPKAAKDTLSWTKAFALGMNETLNDNSSWELFLIGSVTGALGMPRFRSIKNAEGKFQSPVTIEEGAYNQFKDYREEAARTQGIVDYLNNRVNSPDFKNYYQGLVRHNKFLNDMNLAVDNNDISKFKDAEHSQLVSDVSMFAKAGKLEDLNTLVKAAYDTSDDNLKSITENTTTKTPNGISGPFVDSSGNPMYATEAGKLEMIAKLTKSKDEIMKEINNYSKIRDLINASTNEALTDDLLDELTWMSSLIGNFKDRSTEMAKDIKTSISKVIGNLSSKLSLATQIRNQEGKNHADLTPIYRQSDKAVINLTKTMDSLKSLQSQSDDSMLSALTAKPEVVDYLNKQIDNLDESVLDKESKKDINLKLNDILKLSKAIDVFSSKLDEYTSNPAKLLEDHAKIDTDKIKEEEANKKASIKDRLRNAKDLLEYRSILSDEEDDTDDAVKDLQNEKHDLTIANKNINSRYRNLQNSILNNKDIDDETKLDALDMLDNHYNKAQSLDEFNNQNSANLNDEDYFNHGTGFNEGSSSDRFLKAKYTIDKAFEKTAKDNKFMESLSELLPIQSVVDKATVRGVDKDTTGDSKTSTTPTESNSNDLPKTIKEIPVGDYSIDEVKEENKNSDTNDKKLTSKDNSLYYIPAVPELDIEASRNGDYRNFDEVKKELNPKLDFSKIYNYLSSNNAFSYVNEGNLKEGDRLGFMIDPNFSDTTIFIIDKKNNLIVGSLFESDYKLKLYEGLEQLVNKIYQEYKNRGDRNSKFIATPTTRVSLMLVGRIPYIADEKNLKNVIEEGKANSTIFGIVKNGSITTNEAIPSDLIMMQSGLDGKEGRLYMLLPNAAGKYSPVAVRVKHFNAEEFNLDYATIAETPMGKSISKAINDLARSSSLEDITNAMVNLILDIHLQDEIITPIENNKGRGILISSKVKGADGKYEMIEIDGKLYIKETRIPIYFTKEVKPVEKNGLSLEFSSFEEADIPSSSVEMKPVLDIVKEITNALYSLNKPLQVSTGRINLSGYNARIINSNILSSNISSTKIKGSFFTTDYFDKSGNLHAAITVANNRPSVGRKIETVVGGKESVIPGTPVNLNNILYYVDLSTKEIRDKFNNKVTTNLDLLLNLAWVRNNYGRLKSTGAIKDNKVLLPDGRVLDISKLKILSGKEYDKFIDSLDAVKDSTEANYLDGLKAVEQMQENLKLVDSQTYSILEDDGNYYDYTPAVDKAQSRDTILDNGLHPLILLFFNSSEPIVQPDTMTKKAYWALVDLINNIKEALENRGERFISNNITLFYKYANGDRIAAKVDIMTMDKDGRFRLYAVRKESLNKDDIQKITKELSIMSNLFSSQYNLPIYSMAIIPFSVKTRGSKVSETKLEKGISIKLNTGTDTPAIGNILKAKSTLPIFESSLETLKPINDVNTDNRSLDSDTIGYFLIEGKLHTGYLMPIGNIEGNELYLTRTANMTKGFKDTVAHAATYNYFVVFPNGETFNIKNNSITKDPKEMAKTAINLLSKNPNRVKSMSTSDTLLYKKGEEVTLEVEKPKLTAANLLLSSNNKLTASQLTVLKELAVADIDEEFEDDLDLDDITDKSSNMVELKLKIDLLESILYPISKSYSNIEYSQALRGGLDVFIPYPSKEGSAFSIHYNLGESEGEVKLTANLSNLRTMDRVFRNTVIDLKLKVTLAHATNLYLIPGSGRVKLNSDGTWKIVSKIIVIVSDKPITQDNINSALSGKLSFGNLRTEVKDALISKGFTEQRWNSISLKEKENILSKNSNEESEDTLTLRRVLDTETTVWNQEKELNWLSKVLPKLSENDRVQVVKGLIKVGRQGALAWGKFDKGVITLSDIAANGTTYHEAFHVVFNLLLGNKERQALYDEARKLYGEKDNLSLEEDMAEGFREYVTTRQNAGLLGKIKNFFKDLWIKVTNWNSIRPHLTAYYQMINNGEYSNRELPVENLSQAKARQEEYSKEMQNILDKASRDSKGNLLAPNGKKSNLTERQYAQVRTKAFKKWFGDWENNPENASKVVDENGEPLVVYHRSPNKFNTFDVNKIGTTTDTGQYGKGFYFGVENNRAEGNNVYEVFLNIRNPYNITKESRSSNIAYTYNRPFNELSDWHKKNISKEEADLVNSKDGIIDLVEDNEFVVKNSNQIKSATENIGTFSRTNDDIRYREVPNSSFESLDTEMQENLLKKGWTAEKFNSISQEERDQTLKCIAF